MKDNASQNGSATVGLSWTIYQCQGERTIEVKNLDLDYHGLPIERALGVQRCVNSDSFQFKLELNKHPLTKLGIMSIVSSVYDPLGFWHHFIQSQNHSTGTV